MHPSNADDLLSIPLPSSLAHRQLLLIEITLREWIVNNLTSLQGPHWYRHALPAPLLEKYRLARLTERNTPWLSCVPHHPIYYLDFPDLATIIDRKDTWEAAFSSAFRRKDVFLGDLRSLEPIRNKIAHNRFPSDDDLHRLQAFLDYLREALTPAFLRSALASFSHLLDIPSLLSELRLALQTTGAATATLKPFPIPTIFAAVLAAWWFDEDYLGFDPTLPPKTGPRGV